MSTAVLLVALERSWMLEALSELTRITCVIGDGERDREEERDRDSEREG